MESANLCNDEKPLLSPSFPAPMTLSHSSTSHPKEEGFPSIEMTESKEGASGNSNIVKNQSHSLKRSILNRFLPLTFSLLAVVSLSTLIFLYVSNRHILNETYLMLKDQYSRYGGLIAQGICN
jgi:hypothetical protein